MQLGFVIDHSRCIGCHACTVACKAENDVPLGSFRTWVKYVEEGSFPELRRSFAVLRCNQCTDAPCVTICPVRALHKRPDGIVDIDASVCIGCKACMQGCPYDALYLHPQRGIAEKCHFCAHRVESGLAPACAVVCPTEAIVPGDFHDPASAVSRLRASGGLAARKVEAGTGPNVWYREASAAALAPLEAIPRGGYLWAARRPGAEIDSTAAEALEARARTTYDVDHALHWGWKVAAYVFTKSVAAGLGLVLALAALLPGPLAPGTEAGLAAGALFFLALTGVLLVVDLKRPERFLLVLLHANWGSWLARGALILLGYSIALTAMLGLALAGSGDALAHAALAVPTAVLAILAAAYTGWLFGQARGRVLWLKRGLWLHLVVQAAVAGAAAAAIASPLVALEPPASMSLRIALAVSLVAHGAFVLAERHLGPRRRTAEYRRAIRLLERPPLSRWRTGAVIVAGLVLPLLALVVPGQAAAAAAGVLALFGLAADDAILVRAGQAVPLS